MQVDTESFMNLDDPKIRTSWLDDLQVRSWNLELLISGISIILLINSIDRFDDLILYLKVYLRGSHTLLGILRLFTDFFMLGLYIFLVNLILNMILRGLWIGAIGLRSVGDPDRDIGQKFRSTFQKRLNNEKVNLDQFIVGLDRLCSTIFSFTFLSVFIIISFAIAIGIFPILNAIHRSIGFDAPGWRQFFIAIYIIYLLMLLLYFIDFVSLGALKRIKWFSKGYYPFYRVMGYITLAFLYRNLYYNLINRRFSRKLALFLVPYVVLILTINSLRLHFHPFFSREDDEVYLSLNYYDDLRPQEDYIWGASIPSQVVSSGYVPLFIAYSPAYHPDIDSLCPDFIPKESMGLRSNIHFNVQGREPVYSSPEEGLACLSRYFQIYLNDSLVEEPEFTFFIHPSQKEKGLFSMLQTHNLLPGKHQLSIYRTNLDKPDSLGHHIASIPFWLDTSNPH